MENKVGSRKDIQLEKLNLTSILVYSREKLSLTIKGILAIDSLLPGIKSHFLLIYLILQTS